MPPPSQYPPKGDISLNSIITISSYIPAKTSFASFPLFWLSSISMRSVRFKHDAAGSSSSFFVVAQYSLE